MSYEVIKTTRTGKAQKVISRGHITEGAALACAEGYAAAQGGTVAGLRLQVRKERT